MQTISFLDKGNGEQLPICEASVSLYDAVELEHSDKYFLSELIDSTPWRCEEIIMWGKKMQQPRLSAWYGDSHAHYSYSGIYLSPMPWTSLLNSIKHKIESIVNAEFNSVLLNYYRNNRDSMGLHSDDEKELGNNPIIASLSLGAERTLVFKHKQKKFPAVKIPLHSGSLLVMSGETQRHWTHGINKDSTPCGARVNLTFRKIIGSNLT